MCHKPGGLPGNPGRDNRGPWGWQSCFPPTSAQSLFWKLRRTAIMKSICAWARTSPSLARSYILVFACGEQCLYIPPTRGIARVDSFSTGNLANGLTDLAEPLDALCNGAHRFLGSERVDLGVSARNIQVGQDQDVMQCDDCAAGLPTAGYNGATVHPWEFHT